MNGNLMDTNVIVRILNNDTELIDQLSEIGSLCTCSIVLGELLYGAAKSLRTEQNRNAAISFCSCYPLYTVTDSVADVYGSIKHSLLSHGHVLPENDIWIAATALANDMAIVTQDKHFDFIPNLKVIKA